MNPQPVEIAAPDGVALRGQRWSGGSGWIVLVHEAGENEDLDQWRPLVPSLLAADFTVLAMDLRGHGASGGCWDASHGPSDLVAVVTHVRQQAPSCVALVATGVSALDTLRVAALTPLDGLVLLSPPPLAAGIDDLRGTGEAKLVVVGAMDLRYRRMSERLQRASIGWALTISFPTQVQGLDLLTSEWSAHVQEQVQQFVAECRFRARCSVQLGGS